VCKTTENFAKEVIIIKYIKMSKKEEGGLL